MKLKKEIISWSVIIVFAVVAFFVVQSQNHAEPVTETSTNYNSVLSEDKIGGTKNNDTECSITYSAWSKCNWDNTQTRFVISVGPNTCSGGQTISDAVTTRSCEYVDEPIFQTLKSAIYDGDNYGMATIVYSAVQDLINKHEGEFEYSYITENTLYPFESVYSNQLIHTYHLSISDEEGLVINYNLRPDNNAQADIFDITIYDTNADGIGDTTKVNKDYFKNLSMDKEKIRGTWLSIINQYVLMFL